MRRSVGPTPSFDRALPLLTRITPRLARLGGRHSLIGPPLFEFHSVPDSHRGDQSMPLFRKLMAANRGEIAIRVFRSAHELGVRTVAIYSHEDRFATHRLKADEAYEVGKPGEPIRSYLDIDAIVALAKAKEVDAIHPGYGFLSENAEFARGCARAGIAFVGPRPDLLDLLGDKVAARKTGARGGHPRPRGKRRTRRIWTGRPRPRRVARLPGDRQGIDGRGRQGHEGRRVAGGTRRCARPGSA